MDDKGLNAPALARELKTDRSNITRYLRGERAPQYNNFLTIVNYFSCSADYILGLTDYLPQNLTLREPQQAFKDRLRYVIEFCGFTQYKLEQSNK
ncbi:MAG: helix-turn-helix domain-containing protein, partial [Clostridia bacterium]|nr:helix-turn-helix domain-containing protein [Clostridia bacterium]